MINLQAENCKTLRHTSNTASSSDIDLSDMLEMPQTPQSQRNKLLTHISRNPSTVSFFFLKANYQLKYYSSCKAHEHATFFKITIILS